MKKSLLPILIIIILGGFTFPMQSCKNPNQIKKFIKYSKPYWDDLVRFASKGSTKAAIRYFTRTELAAARIAFNYRLPIYNYSGQITSWAHSESSIASTEGAYQKDFQIAIEKTLHMLDTKKVYFTQLNNEIKLLMDDSANLFENRVSYNETTGVLTISSKERYAVVNFENIIQDATVTTGFVYALKSEI
jgi:hypothetical protein